MEPAAGGGSTQQSAGSPGTAIQEAAGSPGTAKGCEEESAIQEAAGSPGTAKGCEEESAIQEAAGSSGRSYPETIQSCRPPDAGEAGASSESGPGCSGPADRDCRVRCFSKRLVQEVMGMCAEFNTMLLETQQQLSQDRREQELRNSVWNFGTALEENISINGQSWHEASETQADPDIKILEDQFDKLIVDVTTKRKRYPRNILSHVVKMLKAEREILSQYKPVVTPQEIKLDSAHESRMLDLTSVTATISKRISDTMKALPAQIEKAEGFSQVLSIQPTLALSRTHKEIFTSRVQLEDLAKRLPNPTGTPAPENNTPTKRTPVKRKRQSSLSPQGRRYPLRSKRKISLNV
ncbi:hypothetical protein FKM82_010233 [Ascaphus truei]